MSLGRKKKKYQSLADEILGKGKRSNAPLGGSRMGKNVPTGPASTLASRGGIVKVRVSTVSFFPLQYWPFPRALLSRTSKQ